MACGSFLGDLFYLTDSLIERQKPVDIRRQGKYTLSSRGHQHQSTQRPEEDLLSELNVMYAKGQIGKEIYKELKALALQGQLRRSDLLVHQTRSLSSDYYGKNKEILDRIKGINTRLTQLQIVQKDLNATLDNLELRMKDVEKRINEKETAARQAVNMDDAAARERLLEKAEFQTSYERLQSQAVSLKKDLTELDDLQAQLEAKKAELKAVLIRSAVGEKIYQ